MESAVAISVAFAAGLVLGLLGREAFSRLRGGAHAGDAEAGLVRRELDQVRDGLERLHELVRRTGGEDRASFGELSAIVRSVDERTTTLTNVLGNSRLRGQWGKYADGALSVPVMPTFHTAYLLRRYTLETRTQVWSDMQAVVARLHEDVTAPAR